MKNYVGFVQRALRNLIGYKQNPPEEYRKQLESYASLANARALGCPSGFTHPVPYRR